MSESRSAFVALVRSQTVPFAAACRQFGIARKTGYKWLRRATEQILQAERPRAMQSLGKTAKGYDDEIWKLFREGVVFTGSYAKFTQNPTLRQSLLATRGTTLVEASPTDQIWGIGLAEDDPAATDRSKWRGLNLLGETLNRVREILI